MNPVRLRRMCFWIAIAAVFLAAGCSNVPVPNADQVVVAAATPSRQPTRTETPTLLPTPTETPVPTQTLTATATATVPATPKPLVTRAPIPTSGTIQVKLYFVALNDNGQSGKKIGCNDSIVAVNRAIPATSAPLTAALKELLSVRERNYGASGLYNALAPANLKITSVALTNGRANISLTGTLNLGGVCDDPRAIAQLKETALQFSTVQEVVILLNGVPIEKALSGKGG